jgi:hypothetical protein
MVKYFLQFTSNFTCFKQEFDHVNTSSNKFDGYIKYRKGVALVFRFVFETDGQIKFEATLKEIFDCVNPLLHRSRAK